MLHGSGLSDSQYMKCRDVFRNHQEVYNKYVDGIDDSKFKKKKTWRKWFKKLIKRFFK